MAPCKRSAAAIDGDMHHHRLDLAAVKVPARRQHGRNRRAQPRRHARGPPRRSTATCITAASTRRPSKSLPDASTATTGALNHGSMPEVRRADRRRHASPPPRPGGRRSSCPPPARPQPARSTTAPCKRSAAAIDGDMHHHRLDLAAVEVPARRQHGRNRRAQPRLHARGPPRLSTATSITAAGDLAAVEVPARRQHGRNRRAQPRRHARGPPRRSTAMSFDAPTVNRGVRLFDYTGRSGRALIGTKWAHDKKPDVTCNFYFVYFQ